jgi:hypothetical protein
MSQIKTISSICHIVTYRIIHTRVRKEDGRFSGWGKVCETLGERKNIFVENHIARDINSASGTIKAAKTMMMRAIPKKHAYTRTETQFPVVVWSKIWPTRASEHAK